MIEHDEELAHDAGGLLRKVTVLQGDGTDLAVLEEGEITISAVP